MLKTLQYFSTEEKVLLYLQMLVVFGSEHFCVLIIFWNQ